MGSAQRRLIARRLPRLAILAVAFGLLVGPGASTVPQTRLFTLSDGRTVSLPLGPATATASYSSTSKIAMASTPDGKGYWLVQPDGGVFPYGDAVGYGSTGNITLNKPMVGIARTADGLGYWEIAADGGVWPWGDAQGFSNCSLAGQTLNAPIVGVAAMPTIANQQGFWMVAGDGGTFPCGSALNHSYGNPVGHITAPIVGMAATPDGNGYWLVGQDAHVYAFGDAYNCNCSLYSAAPVVGIVATPFNRGYWLVAADGGLFAAGDGVSSYGSVGGQGFTGFTAIATTFDSKGYWMLNANGTVVPFGDAGVIA